MFCEKCGAPLNEGERFCQNCGAVQNAVVSDQPAAQPAVQQRAKSLMILSIVALALAELGLPGLIVAIVARKKLKQFVKDGGQLVGMAKVANILSRIALILGIVMTVVWAIDIVVIAIASAAGALGEAVKEAYSFICF